MCRKRQRRCEELVAIREEAFEEWTVAEELEDVLRAWARLGGRTTLHRHGVEHFARIGRVGGQRRVA